MALLVGARITGVLATAGFAVLITRRIRVEDAALHAPPRAQTPQDPSSAR